MPECNKNKPKKCKDKYCICNTSSGRWVLSNKKTVTATNKEKAVAKKLMIAWKKKKICNPQPFDADVMKLLGSAKSFRIKGYKFTYNKKEIPLKTVALWFRSMSTPFNPKTKVDLRKLIVDKAVSSAFMDKCDNYVAYLGEDDRKIIRHYSYQGDGTINHYIRDKKLTDTTIKRIFDNYKHDSTFLTQSSVAYADSRVKLTSPIFYKDKTTKKYIILQSVVSKIQWGKFKSGLELSWLKQLLNSIIFRLRHIINNAPRIDKDVYVFRGNKDRYGDLTRTDMQRVNSFSSYSTNPMVAKGFAGYGVNRWISRLLVMKGTPLLYMSLLSKYASEQEVLLPDGGLYINTNKCPNKTLQKFFYGDEFYLNIPVKFGTYIWSKKTSEKDSKLITNKLFKGLSAKNTMMKTTNSPFFYKQTPVKPPPKKKIVPTKIKTPSPPKNKSVPKIKVPSSMNKLTFPQNNAWISSLRAPTFYKKLYPDTTYPAAALLMKEDILPITTKRLNRYVQLRGINNWVIERQKYFFDKEVKSNPSLRRMFMFYYKFSKELNIYYYDRKITPQLEVNWKKHFGHIATGKLLYFLINTLNKFIFSIPKYKKTDLFVFTLFSKNTTKSNNRFDSMVYPTPRIQKQGKVIDTSRIIIENAAFILASAFVINDPANEYEEVLLPIGGTVMNEKKEQMRSLFNNNTTRIEPVSTWDYKSPPLVMNKNTPSPVVVKKKTPTPKKKTPSPKKKTPTPVIVKKKTPSPNKKTPTPVIVKKKTPTPVIVKKKTPSPKKKTPIPVIIKKKKYKIKKKDLHPPCREPAPGEDYDCRCGWVKK